MCTWSEIRLFFSRRSSRTEEEERNVLADSILKWIAHVVDVVAGWLRAKPVFNQKKASSSKIILFFWDRRHFIFSLSEIWRTHAWCVPLERFGILAYTYCLSYTIIIIIGIASYVAVARARHLPCSLSSESCAGPSRILNALKRTISIIIIGVPCRALHAMVFVFPFFLFSCAAAGSIERNNNNNNNQTQLLARMWISFAFRFILEFHRNIVLRCSATSLCRLC